MPITIDGRKYNVGKAVGSVVNILVDPAVSVSWRKTYRRRAGPEDDASLQARVQADVTRMQREKVRGPGRFSAPARRSRTVSCSGRHGLLLPDSR